MKKKRVLVVGLGRSGRSILRFFDRSSQLYWTYDDNENISMDFSIRTLSLIPWDDIKEVILSPSIALDHSLVLMARQRNIVIKNDIEVALSHCLENINLLAVTGSNGKSTVVHVLHEMLSRHGVRSHCLGNIGVPPLDVLDQIETGDYVILELSSFQLEHCYSLKARASVILNVYPTHQERYPSFFHYCRTKMKISQNQTEDDLCVISSQDFCLQKWMCGKSRVVFFDKQQSDHPFTERNEGLFFHENLLLCWDDLLLQGRHNRSNIMAIFIVLNDLKFDMNQMAKILPKISGLPHRVEWVRSINKVHFINDSKATNAMSVCSALEKVEDCFLKECSQDVILIIGGFSKKKNPLFPIASSLSATVKVVIIYGSLGETFFDEGHIFPQTCLIKRVKDVSFAVRFAYQISRPGSVVILSPGFSSFDLYRNFEERGNVFRKEVLSL